LLNQPITWAQGFADQIEGQATKCGRAGTISKLGTPVNDYFVNFKDAFKCSIPGTNKTQSFAMSGTAGVGTGLSIFGGSEAAGPAGGDGTALATNDTLVLNPPPGFTGTSVEIGLKETYTLIVEGANARNRGSASVCFRWTGRQTHVCFPLLTNGNVTKTLRVQIVLKKSVFGFEFNLQLGGAEGVATITGSKMFASVAIGGPQFTLPPGWTSTWQPGE
jgi:hypothetical protein